MRVGREEADDEILFLGVHRAAALAAAILSAVGRERGALHIAAMGDHDDHVLALDESFVFEVEIGLDEFRAARHGELLANGRQARP